MRVLGVDPGLRITGYACIEPGPTRPVIIEAGVFRLPRANATLAQRLEELDRDFTSLLERTSPQVVAIEGLFAHYKHPATAIIMGHGRGVLLLAAQRAGLPILELKPTQVKKSLTGFGGADKAQVQRAVQAECGLDAPPSPPDLADALAIALCTLHRRQFALAD
ncbi:MAG: crossover junction endodeoxyribonuclease RuvC [Phycisphaerales bacterium]|nr:crossover junction endodeoxyribonuclease RuvC [Phycisphaerales bacterium]